MSSIARYDEAADFYEQFAPDVYTDPPMLALLQLLGDVTGLRLLDIACGHGRLTRELARRGASVVGVDLLARLLTKAHAVQTTNPVAVQYIHADVSSPHTLVGEQFDGATCHFGLSDIDDLDGVAATMEQVVQPGGFVVFALLHPCFSGWESMQANPSWPPERGYFAEGWWRAQSPAHGLRPRVGANHRMLATYVNTFARHRLLLEKIAEPLPPPEWLAAPPTMGAVPLYLVGRCRRLATQ